MLEIGVILDDTPSYQNEGGYGKEHGVLDGFYSLSIGDVEGTAYFGESPSDDYHCAVKKVYLPNDSPSSYHNEGEEHFIDTEYKLEQRHIFSSSQLVITKYERERFETEHNMHINESIANDDSTIETQPTLSIQEKRELILKGWLAGKGFNIGQPLIPTQKDVWEELSKVDKNIFQPVSEETISKFFKQQKLCSFKLGRR